MSSRVGHYLTATTQSVRQLKRKYNATSTVVHYTVYMYPTWFVISIMRYIHFVGTNFMIYKETKNYA